MDFTFHIEHQSGTNNVFAREEVLENDYNSSIDSSSSR